MFFASSRQASFLQRRCFCFFPKKLLCNFPGIPAFAGTEPKEAANAETVVKFGNTILLYSSNGLKKQC